MSIYQISSPYLTRLQDLKLWQGNLDALLQNKSKLNDSTKASDYDTISNLSGLDSSISSLDTPSKNTLNEWDRKPISPSKPFEQLLEEKLAEEEPVFVDVKTNRKPFLKKGTGLIRYKQTLKVFPLKEKHQGKSKVKSASFKEKYDALRGKNEIDVTPLIAPNVCIKPKATWCEVKKNSSPPTQNDESVKKFNEYDEENENFDIKTNLKNRLLLNNFMEDDSKSFLNNSERELRIFEKLEERVEHSSFCSTNSSILKLLSSTPRKPKMQHFQNVTQQQSEERKSPPTKLKFEEKNNDECGILEKKIEDLDLQQNVLRSFLDNLRKFVEEEKIIEQCERTDEDSSPDTTISEKHWSTDNETRSPQTSFYTEFENTLGEKNQKFDIAVNTSFEINQSEQRSSSGEKCENCKTLLFKLEKLQKQIPNVQAEKAKVCDFAKELEKKRDQLYREIEKLNKKYDQDVTDLRKELADEKKKYMKEKAIFEMYIKESQNRPTKKEREEITSLKKELLDVKELLKLKETKNGANQARLRTQIKHLEKERDELKKNVENLQKENAKLNASKKIGRPSEVKMLHEINKNLTKLTEETLKKQQKQEISVGNDEVLPPIESRKSLTTSRRSQNELPDSKNLENNSPSSRFDTQGGIFGQINDNLTSPKDDSTNSSKKDRVETVFPDGSKEVKYGNGNIKTVSPDGKLIIMQYYCGDIKETNTSDNTLKYYYAQDGTWHTQFADGSELIEYSTGQKEKKYNDGRREITCPDGIFLTKLPDGSEEILYPDGSKMLKNIKGERVLLLPNGQKEIYTAEHVRREYPDGTVKILHADGSQETRYSSGRIRIKDSDGVLIMDSQPS